jgi:hypothetical protein
MKSKVTCTLAVLAALAATSAVAQGPAERSTDQYLCKDIMREGGVGREIAIAFVHGIFLGKSGSDKFNLETLEKQTDAFIDHCINNPNDKAMDAMAKVKK